jgi:hypothetical protein
MHPWKALPSFVLLSWSLAVGASEFPRVQAIPQPYDQISFQRDGEEIARYHFGHDVRRPFVFPVNGPSGVSLTRMGHPHDPVGHSHHNSVWITHNDVNGQTFWADRNAGQIAHQRIENLEDGIEEAAVTAINHWVSTNNQVLLVETRRTAVHLLPKKEWLMIIDLKLEAKAQDVVLGKTSFGPIAARMAKTIGVKDGGGWIRSSEGAKNEKEVFWKPAKWVDYSGNITATAKEGITLMDHPGNPNHPCVWHVRDDGWMGAALTFNGPLTIASGKPLRLRYGLYIHGGVPSLKKLEERWQNFSSLPLPDLEAKKKK